MGRITAIIIVLAMLVIAVPVAQARSVSDYQNGNQYEWSLDISPVPTNSIAAGIMAMMCDPAKYSIINNNASNIAQIIKKYLPGSFSAIADTIVDNEKGIEVSLFGNDSGFARSGFPGLPLIALRFDKSGRVELPEMGLRFDFSNKNIAFKFSVERDGIRLD